jgi:2-polyprenyl-6-methoxyphenol hydroxylase-like FAD-dependent oxidoreductase
MHMTFGRRAFFGHLAKPGGELYWFSNVAWPVEPRRGELQAIADDAWRRRLLELHGDAPAPIPDIIQATTGEIGKWAIYDLPSLATWHEGPVCLIGDAAHATSPHVGQGASLALEDAIVLTKCLRDVPNVEEAFATYERLRKDRVEALVKEARRTGDRKAPSNRVTRRIRDLVLPFFLKLGVKNTRPVYAYKVD